MIMLLIEMVSGHLPSKTVNGGEKRNGAACWVCLNVSCDPAQQDRDRDQYHETIDGTVGWKDNGFKWQQSYDDDEEVPGDDIVDSDN